MRKITWPCVILWGGLTLRRIPARLANAPSRRRLRSSAESLPTTAGPLDAADLDAARRLLQQGKYDDAIAKLHDIEEKQPATPGTLPRIWTCVLPEGRLS